MSGDAHARLARDNEAVFIAERAAGNVIDTALDDAARLHQANRTGPIRSVVEAA